MTESLAELRANIAKSKRQLAAMELQVDIIHLEHATEVVPFGSDPTHCAECAEADRMRNWLRIQR